MFDALLAFWQAFVQWIINALDFIARLGRTVYDWFIAVIEAVADFFVGVWDWFWDSAYSILVWLKYVWDWVWELLRALWIQIYWAAYWTWDFIVNLVIEIFVSLFLPAWSVFLDWGGEALAWIGSFLLEYGDDILLYLIAFFGGAWLIGGGALVARILAWLFSRWGVALAAGAFARFLTWLFGFLGGSTMYLYPTALRLLALLAAVLLIWAYFLRWLFVDLIGVALTGGLGAAETGAPSVYGLVINFVLSIGGGLSNATNIATFAVEIVEFMLYAFAIDLLLPMVIVLWVFAQIQKQIKITINLV